MAKIKKNITWIHSLILASKNESEPIIICCFSSLIVIIVLSSETALKALHKLLVLVLAAAARHSVSSLVSLCVRQQKQKYWIWFFHYDNKFLSSKLAFMWYSVKNLFCV